MAFWAVNDTVFRKNLLCTEEVNQPLLTWLQNYHMLLSNKQAQTNQIFSGGLPEEEEGVDNQDPGML